MKIGRNAVASFAFAALLAAATMPAQGQGAAGSPSTTSGSQPSLTTQSQTTTTTQSAPPNGNMPAQHVQPGLSYATYHRPTHTEKLKNYFFDAFGPYSIVGSIGAGSIHQATNAPPDWGQGWQAWGARVGSSYGVSVVTQTTRYAFSELLREDTLYYRCECNGILPRAKHAVLSTFTARAGEDGHRVFSIPAIVAPYAGGETAALLWYPSRFGPKDGFRMGNYNLLDQIGMNLGLEFIWGGPHTFLNKVHVPVISNVTGSTHSETQDKP
jgi:hypothetical protein